MSPEFLHTRDNLLAELRRLYELHGLSCLSTKFLRRVGLYGPLLNIGLRQTDYVAALGLTEEFENHRSNFTYSGKTRLRWSWERVVDMARQAMSEHGELPAMDWFRKNKQTGLVNAVFRSGHSWEELRAELGCFEKSTFRQSRNGMRWLSQPEVSMSDFLYARGVKHIRGQRYDQGYAEISGRRHGTYDMHFLVQNERWIDVEIWGDLPDNLSDGKYARTRELKERWNANNPNFLGIQFQDCFSEDRLTSILEPYIGIIAPFQFDKPTDPYIETAHWSNADELLETCRQIAAQMPDGIFPNEQWLRKRGKYIDRPGIAYNSLAIRINQRLGGTRNVRQLLDQSDASTTRWTRESIIEAWREFQAIYGVAPTALATGGPPGKFSADVVRRANAIRAAASRHGVLEEAREGRKGHKVIWTPDAIRTAWNAFEQKYGFPPSKAVGAKRREKYTSEIGNEAARIYNSARKYGMLEELRAFIRPPPDQ